MRINRRVSVLPCRCGAAISNQFLRTTSTTVPASIEPFPPASPAKRNAHAPCAWHKGKGQSRPTTKSLAGLLVDREKQKHGPNAGSASPPPAPPLPKNQIPCA